MLGLIPACASDRDAIDSRLADLSEDISRLQATNDRLLQRVDALELERTTRRERPAATPAAPLAEHAPLKVVRLEPSNGLAARAPASPDVSPAERPDAPGDRPVIRLRGKADPKSDDRAPQTSVRVVDEVGAK